MENAFDYSAFYEKFEDFLISKKEDKEFQKILAEPDLSFYEFIALLLFELKLIEDKTLCWEDIIAQASLIYSKSEWKVFCNENIEIANYMPNEEGTTFNEYIKYIFEGIVKLYQINPKIDTLLNNLGIKDKEKFIKILTSTDSEEKKYELILKEPNGIESIDYKQFNVILIFIIAALQKQGAVVEDSGFDRLNLEDQLEFGLIQCRVFSLFIRENYSEYLKWKNQYLIEDKIKYMKGDVSAKERVSMNSLFSFHNVMGYGKNYINNTFDIIHSLLFTDKRKCAIVQLYSKDRYASYVQGLYNDYCEQNNIPLASRFYFSDKIKAFVPDIVNIQTENIKTEIESKEENIAIIDVSCYRLKKPKNFNVAKLGELYEKMEGFLSGGKFNFVFLFGCNNNYTDSKPINWHGTAPELKFFIKSLYQDDKSPDWTKVSYIFSKKFKPVTLSNGKVKENILITKAIESCKS